MEKEFLNPSRGFTHVVTVRSGDAKTIYVSGQVGWEEGQPAPATDLAEQAAVAFRNLAQQLEAAGASRSDVVKLNVFIKEIDPDKVRVVGRAQAEHFALDPPPAATWVGVTGLVRPQLLVEIEAVAVVGV